MSPFARGILVDTALLSLCIALGLSLLFGLLAVLRPSSAARLNAMLSRRVSIRQGTRFLERPITIERHLYRHHRWYGGAIVGLSLFVLLAMSFWFDPQQLPGPRVAIDTGHRIVGILLQTMRILFWIGSLFALIVGCFMVFRPSALKKFEQMSNQWISTRRGMRGLERDVAKGDSLFERQPRVFGAIVSLASSLCLLAVLAYWAELQ